MYSSAIECFWTPVDMDRFSCFGRWNSWPNLSAAVNYTLHKKRRMLDWQMNDELKSMLRTQWWSHLEPFSGMSGDTEDNHKKTWIRVRSVLPVFRTRHLPNTGGLLWTRQWTLSIRMRRWIWITQQRLLSKNMTIRIYKTIILPVFLYGCETWSLTLREEHTVAYLPHERTVESRKPRKHSLNNRITSVYSSLLGDRQRAN
jgi:hypothetical protein